MLFRSAQAGEVTNAVMNTALANKADKLFATNLVTNGDFSNGTMGWSVDNNTTFTVVDGVASIVTTLGYKSIYTSGMSLISTNKYYVSANLKCTTQVQLGSANQEYAVYTVSPSVFEKKSTVITFGVGLYLTFKPMAAGTLNMDNFIILNLTQIFGAGKERSEERRVGKEC